MQRHVIRELAAADRSGVLSLSRALESDETPCSFWGLTTERLEEWADQVERHLLVARQGDEITGVACFVRGGRFQYHLAEVSVAVRPSARRSGVASELLRALEELGCKSGILLFKALIWVHNSSSRSFCERNGYEHRATLYAEFMSEQFGEIDDCVYYKRLDGQSGSSD